MRALVEVREALRVRPVLVLWVLLGVQVIEVAEELVEAVDGGQELVAVAEVVLAELRRSRSPGALSSSAIVGSSARRPMSAPGMPTLLSPVR